MSPNVLEFNKEKFKTVLHYIIDEYGCKFNVGRTAIFKLLYFADFNFYEIYEKPLTNEIYEKYPQGPVPSHFHNVKKELVKEKLITETEKPISLNRIRFNYTSLKTPDISVLSTEELNVINEIIVNYLK